MEALAKPHPTTNLSTHLYYQLTYTLIALLPPPIDDTPAALYTRNHAAIAKVAALLPVGANEADLAAHCIAARAQAEEMLRLIRQNADDIDLVIRLNAQYGSMVRTSLSVQGRLMRIQALRHKRQAIEAAATEDAWAQHIAERSMLAVAHPAAAPQPAAPPKAPPAPAQATHPTQPINETVPKNDTNSHDAAFETLMSEQSWNRKSRPPSSISEALARVPAQQPPASTRERPSKAA
jgi:hypothetical protein